MIRAIGEHGTADVRAGRAGVGFVEISVGDTKRGSFHAITLSVQDAWEFARDLKEWTERMAKESEA